MTPLQELTNKIHTLVPETMEEDKSGVSFQRRFDRNIEWAFRAINDDGEDINDTLNILRTNLLALHDKAITEARQDWLRSEIERVGVVEVDQNYSSHWKNGYNQALTSIIARYKEELLELETVK